MFLLFKLMARCRELLAGSLYAYLLNTITRMPFKILFVVLVGAIGCPFALEIQCLHENAKTAKYSSSCIQLT